MSARRGVVLLALLGLAGCEGGAVSPSDRAGLALQIVLAPELASAPDAGTLHVEGPTSRSVALAPGQTVTVENLQPGSYTLSLEAFASGQVVAYAETTTTVVAGQDRKVTITPSNFVPTNLSVPTEAAAGQGVDISFQGVQGADGYVVQWADNAQFSNAQSQTTTSTSLTLDITGEGTFYVRVYARTRFGSNGEPGAPEPVQIATTNKLTEGVPLPDRAGDSGSLTFYTFDVPDGPPERVLQIRIVGGTGDADLAIRLGQDPTTSVFDCASVAEPSNYNGTGLDFCSVIDPQPGTWHVMIQGIDAYFGVTLDARILPLETVPSGGSVSGLAGGASDVLYFNVDLPAAGSPSAAASRFVSGSTVMGTSKASTPLVRHDGRVPSVQAPGAAPVAGTLHLATTGGSGDPDLLATPRVNPFSFSTVGGWDCVSATSETSEEACDIDGPEGGPWTVVLLGFKTFSGVTLSAEFAGTENVLSVTGAGTGTGTVSGGDIFCTISDGSESGTCAQPVPEGTSVTLTAEAEPGYGFAGWNGGGCSGTGDCTVTMGASDVNVEATFTSAPSISPPSFTIVEVNSASCGNGGTSVELAFDYADADGDIDATVPVRTVFTFQPTGTTGQTEDPYAADGDGFSGSVTAHYCIVFGSNTEVALAVSITDMAGLRSAEESVTVPKPTGATVPERPRGASVSAGR